MAARGPSRAAILLRSRNVVVASRVLMEVLRYLDCSSSSGCLRLSVKEIQEIAHVVAVAR